MKIYLDTIGCRLNQAEIETYARQFRTAGHTLVARPEEADLAVINTCTVTNQADSDSRQKIRQVVRAGLQNVIVTGCWATLKQQEAQAMAGVGRVISNAEKDHLVSRLLDVPEETFDLEPVERQPIPGARLRTRAFIKAQDGCNNRCAYCITALARGPGRSRPASEILNDIHHCGDAQEIVLTGVHLGSWGHDLAPKLNLRHLVQDILDECDVSRLRLSSLEPWDIDDNFFDLWQNPRLCRHLHLPLQSGCAVTLQRMRRRITPEAYASLIGNARAAIPGVAITTDIITGFPSENEAEFEESLEFVRRMQFADGHVFTFSARPGTAAAEMPDQVPFAVRKVRNARMRSALDESAQRYQASFVGQELPVLWESAAALGPEGWEMSGLTGNYLRVSARAPRHLWNQITPVRLTGISAHGLQGQVQL